MADKKDKLRAILCPLEKDLMSLTPEVMEKLNISPGSNVIIVKLDNFFYLCNPGI